MDTAHAQMGEQWRLIAGWPYEVSSWGRIRNGRGRVLRPRRHTNGYLRAQLCDSDRRREDYIHRLVAAAFLGAPSRLDSHADHIDRDRTNNRVENLRWLSPEENRALRTFHRGISHHSTKLSEDAVREIRADKTLNNVQWAQRLGVRRETVRDIRLGKERRYDGL